MTRHPLTWRRGTVAVAAGSLVAASLAAMPASAAPAQNGCDNRSNITTAKLLECVRVEGVLEHMQALQDIADANDGTRADASPGYLASVDYVVDTVEAAGWTAEVVPFTYDDATSVLEQLQPSAATYEHSAATGTGEGDVSAPVEAVDISLDPPRASTSGCEASDFDGFTPGTIALVQRGTCSFADKALNAEAAGASAVIIFNQGNAPDRTGVTFATLGGENVVGIPVVGTTFAAGESLAQPGSTARVSVDFFEVTSQNVIAELPGRNDSNVVMAGSHLDSVPAGPGINDNGSGSAALLELAQQMTKSRPQNTVRLAWWGAEELGLVGSTEWVGQQTQAELDDIALYLNFDMIGSPNYYFGVYDANESSFPAPDDVSIPAGSEDIETTFEEYYTLLGEPYDDSEYSGRSDYQAFIENGIPSGGLFTGAEEVKTPEQEDVWGGTAGLAFDPCYHQACDTIDNLDLHALEVNADAVAYAVFTYAASTETVNGVRGRRIPGNFQVPAPAGPQGTFAGPIGGDDGHDHGVERFSS